MLNYDTRLVFNTPEHYSDLRAKIAVMTDPEAINALVRKELFQCAKMTLVPEIRALSPLLLEVDVHDLATVIANEFFDTPADHCNWVARLSNIILVRAINVEVATPFFELTHGIIADVKTHLEIFGERHGLRIMHDLAYIDTASGALVEPTAWEAVEARAEAMAEPLGPFKAVRELGLRMLVPRLRQAAPFLTADDAGTLSLQILDNYFEQFAKSRYAKTFELMCRNRGALNGETTISYADLELQHVVPVFANLNEFKANERIEVVLPAEYPVINFAEDVVDLYKLAISI